MSSRSESRGAGCGKPAAAPDANGRQLLFVEVDLGHYSRQRILGRLDASLAHPEARSILFVAPADERAGTIARWIREAHGEGIMSRVQQLTFDQVREGGWLDAGTEPASGPDGEELAA